MQGDCATQSAFHELGQKYGFAPDISDAALPQKLEELREYLKREIRRELKIKEGAEKLRTATSDKKSLQNVSSIVKKANTKLQELQAELHELDSQILLTQGQAEHETGAAQQLCTSLPGQSWDGCAWERESALYQYRRHYVLLSIRVASTIIRAAERAANGGSAPLPVPPGTPVVPARRTVRVSYPRRVRVAVV